MNKSSILKYCLALILNIAPFLLGRLLYEGGVAIDICFIFIQFLLNMLNCRWANGIMSYLLLNLVMLVSSVKSIDSITQLYYNNVSSDMDTLAVGDFAVSVCIKYILILTAITVVIILINNIAEKKNQAISAETENNK